MRAANHRIERNKTFPLVMYMLIVRQFAQSAGLRFFTWRDQKNAMETYDLTARILN